MDQYKATWESLRRHRTPTWFSDAKFGIYTHWGVYSVAACGRNGTWYPYYMYRPGTSQHDYHLKRFGSTKDAGYHTLVPKLTAERFDAEEWAELFRQAGARFAGPVGEHHDGFSMWASAVNRWNAAKMGPRRDVVGELERAIRAEGMKFMVAMHHAENWFFFPHWLDNDTADPEFADLYGEPHDLQWREHPIEEGDNIVRFWNRQARPSQSFLERWAEKNHEVIDGYKPDLLWFDFGLGWIQEHYLKELVAFYYNRALEWDREVVLTHKHHYLVPGAGMHDMEHRRFDQLAHHEWLTDTSVDNQGAWSYVTDAGFKSEQTLIHLLVDNVSKNGHLLLNVGPDHTGAIPEPAVHLLRVLGRWLEQNGEAIFGTTPWLTFGEGPTQQQTTGRHNEGEESGYGAHDVRFTCREDTLYATVLGWPGRELASSTLGQHLYPEEIDEVTMLGCDQPLRWRFDDRVMTIELPDSPPGEYAFVVRIGRKPLDRMRH